SSGFSILNNTIYENTLAGIDGYGSRANFSYNIIHDNQGPGLTIGYASFHNVTHNVFYDNNGGIIFDHEAAHNNISYNTIVDNETCIQVADQGDSCITNNAAYGGGFILSPSVYINFSGNTLNDKEVRYLWGVDSMSYDLSDYAQAFIYNCTNVSVSNGFFEGCVRGLSIAYSNFTSVTNITTANCVTRGLSVSDSHHSQIVNCTVSGGECGISMQYSSDNVITNITFSDNYNGIRILYTDRVKITNSSFTNSNFGIDTYRCQNLTIVDNEFFGCSIELTGSWVSHFNHTIEGNSVNGKPLGFFQELTDTVVSTDEYGTIMATLCTDVVFEGGNYSNVTVGVVLYNSVNCTITGVRSQYNSRSGVQLASCYNCTVKNCTFTENEVYGIEIGNTWSATRYTKVIDCVVNRNGLGIRVTYDRNTTIVNTTVSYNNDVGILLYYADWFTLTNCTVTDNGMTGVSGGLGFGMSSVTGNVISRNGWYGLYDVGGGSVVASNIISENAGHGISYEGTVLITGNQIHDNGGSGIITEFTGVTNITWNSITGNHEYGIVFERHAGYDRDNLIYGNSLGGNMLGNALDNGEDNRWDDGFIGNAWQDWTGVGVYNVPGLAGSVDNHPWIFGSEPPVRPLPEPTTTFPTTTTPTSPTTTTGPSPGEGWFGVLGLLAISGVSAFMGVIVTLIVVKRRAVPSRD
ncbi:MAG: right-handed parallel beta-helix repeat-containing protein, partial [Candidatus Thorarchaeota archaeon]